MTEADVCVCPAELVHEPLDERLEEFAVDIGALCSRVSAGTDHYDYCRDGLAVPSSESPCANRAFGKGYRNSNR
jgi:hypothetical protein